MHLPARLTDAASLVFLFASLCGLLAVTSHVISSNPAVITGARAAAGVPGYGTPWPDGVITYQDETTRPHLVSLATDRWNQVGLGVRLVAARPDDPVDVIVREDSQTLDRVCVYRNSDRLRCAGQTQIGYQKGRQSLLLLQDARPEAPTMQALLDFDTLVHEFGHVLGMPHLSGDCTVMNKDGTPICQVHRFKKYPKVLCGPYAQDILAARRLYLQARPISAYCNLALPEIIGR